MVLCLLVCLFGSVRGASTQELLGPCEPRLVGEPGRGVLVRPIAYRQVDTAAPTVLLEWLGHSSFLITSPAGLRLLTDPSELHPPTSAPDVVTVSNLHATHTGVGTVPGAPQVLWGLTPERGWNGLALTIKDVALFNVPSYVSRTEPERSPIQNSIFVMRTGGLCLVHLGNLRHPLTPAQLQRIGKPDVLMVPVDGAVTLRFEDVLTVIEQLQPLLVLPMHIDSRYHAEVFAQHTAERYPIRRLKEYTMPLSRALLPTATAIVLFGSP
jgi:L-ascorbate metabolism protein UlaG (beta-lactamase superfamily)